MVENPHGGMFSNWNASLTWQTGTLHMKAALDPTLLPARLGRASLAEITLGALAATATAPAPR